MRTAKLTLATLLLLSAALARAGDGKKTSWKVSGVMEEACSCNAACPCWFDSKPTRSHCSGGQVNFIEKGNYGDVSLDGLAIGTMGQNPDGTTMMGSFGKWDFANIYIDEKASPQQRQALEAIAKATLPLGAPPERTRIQYVPITRKTNGSEHTITIGSIEIAAASGARGDREGHAASRRASGENANPVRPHYAQDDGLGAHDHHRVDRQLHRSPHPGRHGRLPQDPQCSRRRSDSSRVPAGTHDAPDIHRLRAEVGLVQHELHVRE